jgi:hypothetical protein
MEIETFYALMDEACITPLCQKLLQTDRYPALRLTLAFKQAISDDEVSPKYVKEGKFDENAFADSVIVSFPDMVQKLRVHPEKEEQFWNIFHLSVRKAFHFIEIPGNSPRN